MQVYCSSCNKDYDMQPQVAQLLIVLRSVTSYVLIVAMNMLLHM